MRNYVSRFKLPNGKWAYIQDPALVPSAKENIRIIRKKWSPPPYFYHLLPGGHVAALKAHLRSRWFGKIDLSSFFYSVGRHRITRCLKALGFPFRDADQIAIASTVCVNSARRQFALPFGFLQSPLLASIALDQSALGSALRKLHDDGAKVSVYVDDILVSSATDDPVNEALNTLRTAAKLSNFLVNEAKSQGPTKSVLSFNVLVQSSHMHITAERLETMSQSVLMHGAGPVSNGILGYVESINEKQASELVSSFPRSFPHPKI